MAKKRKATPRRTRRIRDDASIPAAERAIEKTMGFPEGSIKLMYPSGRKARADSNVEHFRKRWKA